MGIVRALTFVTGIWSLSCCVGQPTVWSFDYHGDAIYGWNEDNLAGKLKKPATLVHFDSHSDLSIRPSFKRSTASSMELAQSVDINDFILPAVVLGFFDRIIWMRPPWAFEGSYGRHAYFLAEEEGDDGKNIFVSNSSFAFQGRETDNFDPSFRNAHFFDVEVMDVSGESLTRLEQRLFSEAKEEGRTFVLDVDLDVFATENFGAQHLRDTVSLEDPWDVVAVYECYCNDDCGDEKTTKIDGRRFPKRLAKKIKRKGDLQELRNHLCATPLHYPESDAVEVAKEELLGLLRRLHAEDCGPQVVTVCTSHAGYQPPQYRELTEMIPESIANILESGRPRGIPCMLCCELEVWNDESEVVDVFFMSDNNLDMIQAKWQPGKKKFKSSTYLHHTWIFKTREKVNARYKQFIVDVGSGNTRILNLSSLPWLDAQELPGGRESISREEL